MGHEKGIKREEEAVIKNLMKLPVIIISVACEKHTHTHKVSLSKQHDHKSVLERPASHISY